MTPAFDGMYKPCCQRIQSTQTWKARYRDTIDNISNMTKANDVSTEMNDGNASSADDVDVSQERRDRERNAEACVNGDDQKECKT
ncbi:hypothetical protein BM1_08868 [Bipolaris maydis]|nr:hypothetical protein BM1_08868 [Bipolaris maydis]